MVHSYFLHELREQYQSVRKRVRQALLVFWSKSTLLFVFTRGGQNKIQCHFLEEFQTKQISVLISIVSSSFSFIQLMLTKKLFC